MKHGTFGKRGIAMSGTEMKLSLFQYSRIQNHNAKKHIEKLQRDFL